MRKFLLFVPVFALYAFDRISFLNLPWAVQCQQYRWFVIKILKLMNDRKSNQWVIDAHKINCVLMESRHVYLASYTY